MGKRPQEPALSLSRERRLTAGLCHHRSPTWSPDGKWLAFAVGEGAPASWLVTDRRGRVATVLEGVADGSAAFGPDGALAYGRRVGATSEIWFTPGGGLPGVRLCGGDGRLYREPAFSPDGATLVCASDDSGSGRTHLIALDVKRGERRTLTPAAAYSDGHPSFSPDGSALFFERLEKQDAAIFVLDWASGQTSRVTPPPESAPQNAWRRPAALSAVLAVAEKHDAAATRAELVVVGPSGAWPLPTSGRDVRQPAVHVAHDRVRVAYTALLDSDHGQPRRFDILVGRLRPSRELDALAGHAS